MSFSPDGAFPHPSVVIMSYLFFYTKYEGFLGASSTTLNFQNDVFLPTFAQSYSRLVPDRNETFQG